MMQTRQPERDGNGRYKPGQCGNLRGRPRKRDCLTTILSNALKVKGSDGRPNKNAIVDKIIELACEGERWATELCFDRMDGKVTQSVDLELTIRQEAERVAKELGLEADDLIAEAERLLKNG